MATEAETYLRALNDACKVQCHYCMSNIPVYDDGYWLHQEDGYTIACMASPIQTLKEDYGRQWQAHQ